MNIKTSPENRICKYPDCNSIISVYNHADYCNVHLNMTYWEDKVDGVPSNPKESNVLNAAQSLGSGR